MQIKLNSLKIAAAVILAVELILVILFKVILKINIDFLVYVFLVVGAIEIVFIFYIAEMEKKQRNMDISRVLGNEAKQSFEYGKVGIIVYDTDYKVTWISEFLQDRGFDIMGQKLTKAIEGTSSLFKEANSTVVLQNEDKIYEFVRSDDEPAIFVKDITELYNITTRYNRERPVIGLVNFDNYDETIQVEDELKIAAINTNIRQKVANWVNQFHGVIRRIRADRLLVIISEENFGKMLASRFDILEQVKQEAKKLDVDITISMSFASQFHDLEEQDSTVNDLMELVLSRGGDQVAVRKEGHDIEFYGNSSEASEKTSKVRARVMAKGFDGLIEDSSRVFIVPHSDADLDSIGGCLGFDRIVQNLGKDSYIIVNGIKIEQKTKEIYDEYDLQLIENHIFISQQDALSMLDDDSLVIVIDHHSSDLTSCPDLIEQARKVAIIDHHRRRSDTSIAAMMIYNEPSASSAVELVTELIQYQPKDVEISSLDATIMYAGLLVDTDLLKSRCSGRTFEACAALKKMGADVTLANEWLKDSLDDFFDRSSITRNVQIVDECIAVAAVTDGTFSRTSLAKSANYMNSIKGIEASFVIGEIDANLVAISGRSNGKINVQVILEKMGGGGHFNAAGLQKSNTTVAAMKEELLQAIEEYQKGGTVNESNTAG